MIEKTLPRIGQDDKTMKNATLVKRDNYKATIHNKDYALGCHYPEDDWNVVAYGLTEEELIETLAFAYHHTDHEHYGIALAVNPESWHIEIVEVFEVQFEGETIFTYETPKEKAYYDYGTQVIKDFVPKFLTSDAFKREEKIHLKLIAEQQAKKDAEYEAEKEAKERKEYERLQNKFKEDNE